MKRFALTLALLATALAAPALSAQTVEGTFVDPTTGEPIPGARAVLRTPDGREASTAMTRPDGSFTLRPGAAGTYTLGVERIGYALTQMPAFQLAAGETVQRRLTANPQRVGLETMVVQSRARCTPRPGSGPQTAVVWEEARKALGSARESNEHAYRYTVRRMWRKLDTQGSILQDSVVPSDLSTGSPFVAVPLARLAAAGYIEADGGNLLFHAPDARILLSEEFQEGHCFALREAPRDEPGLIGLSFEPVRQGEQSDVRGTLWVDRATSELRRLEFQYTKVPGMRGTSESASGRMDFRRLDDGRWVVSRWNIRMPTVQAEQMAPVVHLPNAPSVSEPQLRYKLTGLREEGGDVLSVVTSTGSRVSLTGSSTLRGLVFDSTTARPLAGARVSVGGPGHSAVTDSLGRFEVKDIPPGDYQVSIASPRLEALGYRARPVSVSLREGAATEHTLAIPSFTTVWASRCGADERVSGTGVVVGAVKGDGGQPEPGAKVTLAWGRGTMDRVQVTADSAGVYRACAVPPGALTLTAEGRAAALTLSQVRVESGQALLQDVSLAATGTVAARPAAAGAGASGGVSGVVRGANGSPVAGATVRFGTLAAVTTDAQGRFRVRGVTPGEQEVTVTHALLGTRTVRLAIPANAGEVELRAAGGAGALAASVQRVVQLAGLNVTARNLGLDINGFYDRQRRGMGYFLGEAELARSSRTAKLTDVLRRVPSVRVVRYQPKQEGTGATVVSQMDLREEYRIASTRSYTTGFSDQTAGLRFCYMDVFIDGIQVQNQDPEASQSIDDRILSDVAAIEVYTGPGQSPPEYRTRFSACGLVLIWTKR
ncbi:MAG TPA: carboxypeptidase regulatory-like domain-containing protein [Longimicrobium sp.]|nr:carboxypeptidase regulatory-like domain-containing protein [Longimicrobium sp.]